MLIEGLYTEGSKHNFLTKSICSMYNLYSPDQSLSMCTMQINVQHCDFLCLSFCLQTLFAASKLKVFDKLKDKGALKAMDIADKINASVHGTERLLDACVALGLLEKTHQGESQW